MSVHKDPACFGCGGSGKEREMIRCSKEVNFIKGIYT
jgi:hypothetical protein